MQLLIVWDIQDRDMQTIDLPEWDTPPKWVVSLWVYKKKEKRERKENRCTKRHIKPYRLCTPTAPMSKSHTNTPLHAWGLDPCSGLNDIIGCQGYKDTACREKGGWGTGRAIHIAWKGREDSLRYCVLEQEDSKGNGARTQRRRSA